MSLAPAGRLRAATGLVTGAAAPSAGDAAVLPIAGLAGPGARSRAGLT